MKDKRKCLKSEVCKEVFSTLFEVFSTQILEGSLKPLLKPLAGDSIEVIQTAFKKFKETPTGAELRNKSCRQSKRRADRS